MPVDMIAHVHGFFKLPHTGPMFRYGQDAPAPAHQHVNEAARQERHGRLLDDLAMRASQRPPEPSACGTAPRDDISRHARAVLHEAVLIRRLAQRLACWLELHQPPYSEATCAEWIAIMRDLERGFLEERRS